MPADRVVINASPLIVLFKSAQVDLLPQVLQEIRIPRAVWEEVTLSKDDTASQQLSKVAWAKLVDVRIHPTVAAWDLGAGESAVLSFALQNSGYWAMVDDAAARKCARSLKIPTLGTGGMIVLAKEQGLIQSVGLSLRSLRDAGLWISDEVIDLLKQQAGEP